eukprot:augustus_masked-scaffold_2-processed-gene-0.13-mRNA-1 protein AED:0.03 eAED:0.03 QI:0/-1/0/1/-1/1/1/0/889
MPLRLEIKKKLSSRTERVKCIDIHPSSPVALCALYSGTLLLYNTTTSSLIKSLNVSTQPLRSARFAPKKSWILAVSDDKKLRVFSYPTLTKLAEFEAHQDYIRDLQVHPSLPLFLTASDDMTVRSWNFSTYSGGSDLSSSASSSNGFVHENTYEGHAHYVMSIAFNPKDPNSFATASLDRTVQVWSLGSPLPNYALKGHTEGVNCVAYSPRPDRPYLLSAADDTEIRLWDYQTKACLHTLKGHSGNVSTVMFHPTLPLILSGSEDGTVRLWHGSTYVLESTLNYGLERVWSVYAKGNLLGIGCDEGTVLISLGEDQAGGLATLDSSSGRLILVKENNEILNVNLRGGSRSVKELGRSDVHVQKVLRNSTGKFVAMLGDGEYVISTAQTLRSKAFGQGQDLAWGSGSGDYAVLRDGKLFFFKNFQKWSVQGNECVDLGWSVGRVESGPMLGLISANGESVVFLDWESGEVVERIEVEGCEKIIWASGGHLVALLCKTGFYVLKVSIAEEGGVEIEAIDELEGRIGSGVWIGDCFVYATSSDARPGIYAYISGNSRLVKSLDKKSYILGYFAKENKLFYLTDPDVASIGELKLLESEIQFQTAVVRDEWELALEILQESSDLNERRDELARFLDNMSDESDEQVMKQRALEVARDSDLRFQYAVQLGELSLAKSLLKESKESEQGKWRELGDLALKKEDLELAKECSIKSKDVSTQFLLASSSGDKQMLEELLDRCFDTKVWNIAFTVAWSLGKKEKCVEVLQKSGKYPEAAAFCRTYYPQKLDECVSLWKEALRKMGKHSVAESLADSSKVTPGLQQVEEPIVQEEKVPESDLLNETELHETPENEVVDQTIGVEATEESPSGDLLEIDEDDLVNIEGEEEEDLLGDGLM